MKRYHNGAGNVYEKHGAFYVRWWVVENGERRQRSKWLCRKDREHSSRNSKAVRDLATDHLATIGKQSQTDSDLKIRDAYDRYLAYVQTVHAVTDRTPLKPSSIKSLKQIWKQHLDKHFGETTVRAYTVAQGTDFLETLTATQSKTTIKHVRSCASSIFRYARKIDKRAVNPWKDVPIPDDAVESANTEHYTVEESENIVSALVDHVDAQLVMALACFLGVSSHEICGLRFDDIDDEWIHVRRGVVRGIVDIPKAASRVRSVPLIDQVRVPLELWRKKRGGATEGWLFESDPGKHLYDLANMKNRVIRPHVDGRDECVRCDEKPKAVGKWRGLHSGRRGACTAIIEATNGNAAIAQAILGHKDMATTLRVYKKQITPQGVVDGMKLYQRTLNK